MTGRASSEFLGNHRVACRATRRGSGWWNFAAAAAELAGVVLAALLVTFGSSPTAFAAPVSSCAACQTDAARRFLGAKRVVLCQAGIPAAEAARLQRALEKCAQRYDCAAADDPSVVLATLRQAVQVVEDTLCDDVCSGDQCGTLIDPAKVAGPVGQAPPAVDPDSAASLDDVDRFCHGHPDNNAAPPLLALPSTGALPDWCDENAAYTQLVAACGTPRLIFVAKGARADVADGAVGTPFPSISDALADCHGACHLLVGPGIYAESPTVSGCTLIEGGVTIEDGVVRRGGSRPRLKGTVNAQGNAIVLARLDVQDPYGALSTNGDVLVSDALLRGGYEGGSSAFNATGPRICRSTIAAGYGGFDIAWHSSRLWVAGSAISACYEGLALSWGSRSLEVIDSVVYGAYNAVGTSWGSVGVDVHGSRLASSYDAVSIHIAPDENHVFPATFDVTVTGNTIVSGALPASDPVLNIVVEGNVFE